MESELEAIGKKSLQHLVQNIVVVDGLIGFTHNVEAFGVDPVRAANDLVWSHGVRTDDATLQGHVARVYHAEPGGDSLGSGFAGVGGLNGGDVELRRSGG